MSGLNNTDLQINFNKETEKQVLQTGINMNLYYTDEYVKWLESIVLRQANGVDKSTESASQIQNVSFNEAEYCDKCGKRKMMKGDGTIELLCECSEVEVFQCAIPDLSKQGELLCGFFEPANDSSSATICKHCGREKWMHPKAI